MYLSVAAATPSRDRATDCRVEVAVGAWTEYFGGLGYSGEGTGG